MSWLDGVKAWFRRGKPRRGWGVGRAGVSVALEGDTHIEYSTTKVVPPNRSRLAAHRVLLWGDRDPTSAHYKILRTQLIQRMSAAGLNTLAVTSAGPGEGKTLTAINLAISLAQKANQTVLLADFDLRKPAVHRYLGYQPEVGLSDYLAGHASLEEVLFNPGVEGLVILPNLQVISNSAEVLSSERVRTLVEELRTRYRSRMIVFDLPPVLGTDDVIAFLPNVEAVMLVIRAGRTREEKVVRAMDMLDSANVIGTVLNQLTDEEVDVYY